MTYKHGAYASLVPSTEQILSYGKGTIPVYIGTAPVHRLKDYKDFINKPVLIRNLEEAKAKLGYSAADDFDNYSLSACIFGHLQNRIKPIAPIVVINVLDPSKHKKSGNKEFSIINDKILLDEDIILNSINISDKENGKDYKTEYTTDGKILITILNKSIQSSVTINFESIDLTNVNEETIVGGYEPNTDTRTGIACVQNIFEELNIIPSVLSAPGWNHIPTVEKELISTCNKIDGHWEAISVTDLDPNAKSLDEARKWKIEKGYNSNREKTCWPKVKVGDKTLWMSIVTIVRMQQTDTNNNNVPYETPSNKQIDITGLVLGDGTRYVLNSFGANKLNEKGITTSLYFGGKWVLWGPHMANFEYGVTNKPEDIFDVNIRTNIYLNNDFQIRNADQVDKPMSRNDVDALLNNEQFKVNSLVSEGKLLYGTVEFRTSENPKNDLINGDFVFNTMVTNTPPGKSLSTKIQYTSEGINTFIGGE